MNIRFFLRVTMLTIFVMFVLVFIRVALDEAQMGPCMRILDKTTGWSLLILGFVLVFAMVLISKEPSHPLIVLPLALVASGIIWGIIIERLLYFFKRRPGPKTMR